jgi:hypothetical protein
MRAKTSGGSDGDHRDERSLCEEQQKPGSHDQCVGVQNRRQRRPLTAFYGGEEP